MWTILLALLHFIVFRIFLATLFLFNTASFSIRSVKLSSSSFILHNFQNILIYIFEIFGFSALQKAFLPCWWKKKYLFLSLNAAFAMEILDVNAQTKSCVICCQGIQIVPLTDSLVLPYPFSQLQFRYREIFSRILLAAVSITYFVKLDVHESVHRDTTMKITNKMHYID